MRDRSAFVVCEASLLEKFRHVVADNVGEVLGMDDPFGADFCQIERELVLALLARRRDPHVLAVVVADGAVEMLGPADRLVQAVEPARNQLAPMAAEEFEAGVTVQRARQDKPQHIDARLGVPTERRRRKVDSGCLSFG